MTGADGRKAATGHPLPRSEEARHDRIPEHLVSEKGVGDDAQAALQPASAPVDPDGEIYGGRAKTGR